MISIPQRYRVNPGPTRVTFTLLPQSGAYFTVGANPAPVQSFSYGEVGKEGKAPIWFTAFSPTGQAAARIEVAHEMTLPQPEWRSPSFCHLYFKPGHLDWIWQGAAIAGDNTTVLSDGEGPHGTPTIAFRPPTQPNSVQRPRLLPCLAASRVSLLDRSDAGNMIFRGNAPLSPAPGNQLIDFDTQHNTLKLAYFSATGQTDFPERGGYVLRNIALLDDRSEEKMLLRELMSFGGTDVTSDLHHGAWYPAAPTAVSRSGILAQMAHWPISATDAPSAGALNLTKLAATRLRGLMNRREALPHIYYLHCPDGRQRTGAMSVWYLLTNSGMPVSEAFMLGCSLNGSTPGL